MKKRKVKTVSQRLHFQKLTLKIVLKFMIMRKMEVNICANICDNTYPSTLTATDFEILLSVSFCPIKLGNH